MFAQAKSKSNNKELVVETVQSDQKLKVSLTEEKHISQVEIFTGYLKTFQVWSSSAHAKQVMST